MKYYVPTATSTFHLRVTKQMVNVLIVKKCQLISTLVMCLLQMNLQIFQDMKLQHQNFLRSILRKNYQNQELVLTCVLTDFSQVDVLTKQFNSRKSLVASLQGSSAEDGKVIATYSVRRKGV